jgi:hypothetical protein
MHSNDAARLWRGLTLILEQSARLHVSARVLEEARARPPLTHSHHPPLADD